MSSKSTIKYPQTTRQVHLDGSDVERLELEIMKSDKVRLKIFDWGEPHIPLITALLSKDELCHLGLICKATAKYMKSTSRKKVLKSNVCDDES